MKTETMDDRWIPRILEFPRQMSREKIAGSFLLAPLEIWNENSIEVSMKFSPMFHGDQASSGFHRIWHFQNITPSPDFKARLTSKFKILGKSFDSIWYQSRINIIREKRERGDDSSRLKGRWETWFDLYSTDVWRPFPRAIFNLSFNFDKSWLAGWRIWLTDDIEARDVCLLMRIEH